MGVIKLNRVKVYAYHGCLVEEGQIGSDYLVDLKINTDLSLPAQSDNLSDTVDYVHLNKIIKEEMAQRSKLLEHVCDRILNRSLSELSTITTAKVTVRKINPPIGGDVASVGVTMSKKRS